MLSVDSMEGNGRNYENFLEELLSNFLTLSSYSHSDMMH